MENYSGRGGRREGAGRPKGTLRTKKTEFLNQRLTPEEKTFLTKILKALRAGLIIKILEREQN